MSIGRPWPARPALVAVHGQAETTAFIKMLARMDDDYKLVFDTGNLLPVSVAETERGVRQRRIGMRTSSRASPRSTSGRPKSSARAPPRPRIARDPLSGFFALRALPLDRPRSSTSTSSTATRCGAWR